MFSSCLVSKLRCYENVHDYPGAFDDDNPIVLKFMLFRNWDYFKRLQLYYNCSAFEKFETGRLFEHSSLLNEYKIGNDIIYIVHDFSKKFYQYCFLAVSLMISNFSSVHFC